MSAPPATAGAHLRLARARWRLPPGEGFNLATASLGLLLALPGAVWLTLRADTPLAAWTLGGYGASLVLLFAATLLHHAFPESVALRRLDHAAVYAAILGTCAPFCLLVAPGPASVVCLAVVGTLCAAGVALKLLAPFTTDGRNLWLYLPVPLPFGVVLARLVVELPALSGLFVVGSAASFVGGAVVDGVGRPAPRAIGAHGLFHLLVLGGCVLAFATIALHAT